MAKLAMSRHRTGHARTALFCVLGRQVDTLSMTLVVGMHAWCKENFLKTVFMCCKVSATCSNIWHCAETSVAYVLLTDMFGNFQLKNCLP